MITFLTTAKSFTGEARQRQLNAIQSWQTVHPDVEVFLFGVGEGYADVADKLGLRWFSDIACGPSGCPRIDAMFAVAEQHSHNACKAYVNCDIMLGPDLVPAVKTIQKERFLFVSQRWDVDWRDPIDFKDPGYSWRELAKTARNSGRLMAPSGIDMFLYRGNFWGELPELVVGRGGYDNYLIFYCRLNDVPVVDGTNVVTLIHQNHDYGHLKGGSHEVFRGEEACENIRQAGGLRHLFTIRDADHKLMRKGMKRNRNSGDWREYCEHVRILSRRSGRAPRTLWEWGAECIGEWRIRRTWKSGRRSVADLVRFLGWAFLRSCGKR